MIRIVTHKPVLLILKSMTYGVFCIFLLLRIHKVFDGYIAEGALDTCIELIPLLGYLQLLKIYQPAGIGQEEYLLLLMY